MHALTLSKASFFGVNNRSKRWGQCQGITTSELGPGDTFEYYSLRLGRKREAGGRATFDPF